MRKKLLAFLIMSNSFCSGAVLPSMVVESGGILSESMKLDDYSGVVGTSSASRQTISAAGTGFTASPNGTTFYVFFSQTLANDLYYEARLSGRYNYASSNPNIPGIPASQLTPPMGYGTNWFLGYNFHPTEKVNLTPYLRLNVSHNISGAVFDDSNGDYVNSTSYATLIGAKLSFRASEVLSPYINIWGGLQRNYLVGAYPNSQTQSNTPVSGILNQIPITYQIGFGMKLTNAVTLLPYWQYTVTINNPDTNAALAIDQGGLNQSSLTGSSYAYGFKLSIAW